MTKLLVAGGYNDDDNDNVEVINLDEEKQDLICDDLPKLPEGVFVATGQLFMRKMPIICGGYGNECKCITFQNGSWNYTADPAQCRIYAASAILKNREEKEVLFVGGGYYGGYLNSTETFDGAHWDSSSTESLPRPRSNFCIAKINESTIQTRVGACRQNPKGYGRLQILPIHLTRRKEI